MPKTTHLGHPMTAKTYTTLKKTLKVKKITEGKSEKTKFMTQFN